MDFALGSRTPAQGACVRSPLWAEPGVARSDGACARAGGLAQLGLGRDRLIAVATALSEAQVAAAHAVPTPAAGVAVRALTARPRSRDRCTSSTQRRMHGRASRGPDAREPARAGTGNARKYPVAYMFKEISVCAVAWFLATPPGEKSGLESRLAVIFRRLH